MSIPLRFSSGIGAASKKRNPLIGSSVTGGLVICDCNSAVKARLFSCHWCFSQLNLLKQKIDAIKTRQICESCATLQVFWLEFGVNWIIGLKHKRYISERGSMWHGGLKRQAKKCCKCCVQKCLSRGGRCVFFVDRASSLVSFVHLSSLLGVCVDFFLAETHFISFVTVL